MADDIYTFNHRFTQDGHGGMALQHRMEMEEIAHKVYAQEHEKSKALMEERMHQIAALAYEQAVKDFLKALEFDIQSISRITIEGCRDVFEGKKAQKYLTDQIMKTVEKSLRGKTYRRR